MIAHKTRESQLKIKITFKDQAVDGISPVNIKNTNSETRQQNPASENTVNSQVKHYISGMFIKTLKMQKKNNQKKFFTFSYT